LYKKYKVPKEMAIMINDDGGGDDGEQRIRIVER